jgi:Heparinase II/III-like protein
VQVDGRNQTRYEWRKNRFRISGPEPEREFRAFIHEPGLDYLHGIARSHEYPVMHERKLLFINGEYWVIVDLLRASESHTYDLLFHLSPPAQDRVSVVVSDDTLSIHSPQLILAQPLMLNVRPSIQEGFVSHSYGEKQCAPIVRLTQSDSSTCFLTVLYPYKDEEPFISVETPEPDRGPQALLLDERVTVQITIAHKGRRCCDELLFADQAGGGVGIAGSPLTSHVLVSRTDQDGRLLFRYQA